LRAFLLLIQHELDGLVMEKAYNHFFQWSFGKESFENYIKYIECSIDGVKSQSRLYKVLSYVGDSGQDVSRTIVVGRTGSAGRWHTENIDARIILWAPMTNLWLDNYSRIEQ
jgi:hypothetical protein